MVAGRETEVIEQSYYRDRKKCGGLNVDRANRLKKPEKDTNRLKKPMSELLLETQEIKDIAAAMPQPQIMPPMN